MKNEKILRWKIYEKVSYSFSEEMLACFRYINVGRAPSECYTGWLNFHSNHPAKYKLQLNNSLGVRADWKFNLIKKPQTTNKQKTPHKPNKRSDELVKWFLRTAAHLKLPVFCTLSSGIPSKMCDYMIMRITSIIKAISVSENTRWVFEH